MGTRIEKLRNYQTEEVTYPVTVAKAVYTDKGERLDQILKSAIGSAGEDYLYEETVPRDADTLAGRGIDEIAEKTYVGSEIKKAKDTLNARIDNIVSGVSSDSEVVDARTGVDGVVHTSLKERIDSEVGELKGDLVEIEEKVLTQQSNINWLPKNKHEGWGFWADGTVNKNATNATMSDYIRVNAGDIIFGYSPNGFHDCVFYDENYNLVQYMQYNPKPYGTIVPTGSKNMRFSVNKENYDTTKIYINPLDINIDNVESLKDTLNKIGNGIGDLHFNIHIKSGTYNITFTSDEINSAEYTADGFVGLVVGNNVNLIGESKDSTIISCEIDTSYSVSKRDAISTLNIKGNCKLENLTVKSKNIRYPIHDDFPQSIDTIHKIKNCSFIAGVNAVGQKTCGYGLGTISGETIIFDNCYIEPNMIYHNNTGFTKSSLVTMNNCEISEVFNLWDFDCEVPCYLELNNIKCPQLNHSYNGTHEQTINISGIGSYPDIVTCSSDVKYFLGNCVKKQIHYGALSGKCMVDYYASNDPKFRTARTGTNGLLGIMLEDVGGDEIGIIQTNGYISANKLGDTDMSSWSVGTLLKPNETTFYLEPTNDLNIAVAKVVLEIDSVKYIKLLF